MKVVHETVIKDIVDIFNDVKNSKISDLITNARKNRKKAIRSIAQSSSNFTLVYPMLVSNSIDITSCSMVSKATERKNAQMIQLLLSAYQQEKLTGDQEFDPIRYLQQFHKNLNISYTSTDDILDTVNDIVKLVKESCGEYVNTSECIISESQQIKYLQENRIKDSELPDMFSETAIHEFKIDNKYGKVNVYQERTNFSRGVGYFDDDDYPSADVTGDRHARPTKTYKDIDGNEYEVDMHSDEDLVKFAKLKSDALASIDKRGRDVEKHNWDRNREAREQDKFQYDRARDLEKQQFDRNREMRDQEKHLWSRNKELRDQDKFQYDRDRDLEKQQFDRNRESRDAEKHNWDRNRELRDIEKQSREIRTSRIKDLNVAQQTAQGRIAQLQNVDVKKANELVGTPIMVTVHITNDQGLLDPVSFLIAIKSKMYPLDSKDIIQRIINKNKDRNFFGKLVKVATGEISFVRDFLFAVDNAKMDAKSQSNKGNSSKLWRVLERMSRRSKLSRAMGKQNEYMAITTLVISQEEVEYIKKYANMDMEKEVIAKGIIDAYNLLSLVIVDETNECVKFLYNEDQALFEELSFNQLEREATDGSYKKMVNLITKIK